MKIEVDKNVLDDLEQDKTTFALSLSALVFKFGTYNRQLGRYEVKITLDDLKAISESNMFVENQLEAKNPFTLVWVKPKGANRVG